MTSTGRERRTAAADAECVRAYRDSRCPPAGVALLAVGGYGRRELAPGSDLDLVLVVDDGVPTGEWATRLWYPLWDSGRPIDHAVRSAAEVLDRCDADLRVALGLLDLRHVAGDPNLTLRVRSAVLAGWRARARRCLPDLRAMVADRHRRAGELAHVAVPDLKEAAGGLRDATVLNALVATWLVDVPHTELERCRQALLDVRDALHEVTGRATDRVAPELWPDLAASLELADGAAAQRHTRALARRIAHLSLLTWRRADAVLHRPRAPSPRRPALMPVAAGVALHHEEVVLVRDARPDRDPALLLRAAAEAAERNLVLAPATAARLARDGAPLPEPWPAAARELLVRLLAAGPGLRSVWETLDETGALDRVLPEWSTVRLLPHVSPAHRFTVDRHLVETCVEAAALLSSVARPDLLVVACLLHDIGKAEAGRLTAGHAALGAPVAAEVARRIGYDERDTRTVETLVRRHLLLPEIATGRDPEDPATVAEVTARIGDPETLALLAALTEADARATSAKAWTSWRARMVATLVRRVATALDPGETAPSVVPATPPPWPAGLVEALIGRVLPADGAVVEVREEDDGSTVLVGARDRIGLLADVAAVLALERVPIRSARAWTEERSGWSLGLSAWSVAGDRLDAAVLRQRLLGVAAGRLDPASRFAGTVAPEPTVLLRPDASERATVLEVRAADRPGLVFIVCRALASLGIAVRSAHAGTLGPRVVDVFYLQEDGGVPLTEVRAASAAHAVRAALAASDGAVDGPR